MLSTLANFRELGGYQGKEGKKVKNGLIYRSGEINTLSPEDHLAFQEQYHIGHIFDLRSDQEVKERPNQSFDNINSTHIDIMKGAKSNASIEQMQSHLFDPEAYMKEIYREFIDTKEARSGYHQFLGEVSELHKPFIFHCFAGKDRTGFGAALILSILGVSREDIYYDYLLTNKLRQKPNEALLQMMKTQGASDAQLDMMSVMMNVKSDYLDTSYQELDKEYGGIENYIKNGLKVDQGTIELIQHKYLQ